MNIVSISSMTGEPGCTWLTKLLLFVMTSTAVVKNSVGKTWDRAWKILIWSFEAMAKNKWPTHDWNNKAFPADSWEGERAGSTLCGEYTFRFFQIAGDLDELCNGFRLRHFNSTRNPCFLCKCDCNVDSIPWSDLSNQARWRSVRTTWADWYLEREHAIFRSSVLGLSVYHVCLCILHCLDGGVLTHSLGSVIFLLAFDTELQGSIDDRIDVLFQTLSCSYDAMGTPAALRVPYVKFLGVFERRRSRNPTSYPELHCKAAVLKHCWSLVISMCIVGGGHWGYSNPAHTQA